MKALRTLAVVVLAFAACPKPAPVAKTPPPPETAPATAPAVVDSPAAVVDTTPTPTPEPPPPPPPEPAPAPGSPAYAVLAAVEAVRAEKPADLWALLPPSYQKDVQGLVTLAGSKLDKELFELGVKVLAKGAVVLEKQADKLGVPAELKKVLLDGYALIKEIKLLDYKAVSKLDLNLFINTNGGKIMGFAMGAFKANAPAEYEELRKALDSVRVRTLKIEGDKAELEILAAGEIEKVSMTLVDGRWLPSDMVTGWSAGIAEAQTEITAGMAEIVKNKKQNKEMLNKTLAALAKAEKGDFSELQPLMGEITGM